MSEKNLYSFQVKTPANENWPLEKYKGQVVLIVNVASKCGFTPQYKGLEELYQKYRPQGFMILGFPCNQFGAQEPGDNEEIQSFCKLTYDVSFPIMAKVDVNGENADPLFNWLKESAPGILGTEGIKWNFTKFLIDKNGAVLKRFAPNAEPRDLASDIEKALN